MIRTLHLGELQQVIEEQVINPSIHNEIKSLVSSREYWRKIANITETLGNIFIAISTMFAFASGIYQQEKSLAFTAGCINTTSLALLKFSSYAGKESRERNDLLNNLLVRLNIQP